MLRTNNIKNQSDNKRWNKWAWRAVSWKDTDQCAAGILRQFCCRFVFLDFSRTSRVTQSYNHKQSWVKCVATMQIAVFLFQSLVLPSWHEKSKVAAMQAQRICTWWCRKFESPSWYLNVQVESIWEMIQSSNIQERTHKSINVGKEPNCIKFVRRKVWRWKTKNFKVDNILFCSWQ